MGNYVAYKIMQKPPNYAKRSYNCITALLSVEDDMVMNHYL